MGTAYRSCKLSNLGSPTTAIQLRKCDACILQGFNNDVRDQLAHCIETLL
jgi:hypothetical protein